MHKFLFHRMYVVYLLAEKVTIIYEYKDRNQLVDITIKIDKKVNDQQSGIFHSFVDP